MTKNKHDHTATKKIKAWLFAIMLLLPFLFLIPTGLYYGLNQNAQLSERTEETPLYAETNEVNNIDDVIIGNIYRYTNNFVQNNLFSERKIANINIDLFLYQYPTYNDYNISEIYFYYVPNNTFRLIISTITEQNTISNIHFSIDNREFDFILTNIVNNSEFSQVLLPYMEESNMLYQIGTQTNTYINDISTSIINAWNSTWQNPLFSWTSYSPFYAPMQSFTSVFGIDNMQIANVLTYLATITAIYIVFDIVIELFTYLTHLIPRSD